VLMLCAGIVHGDLSEHNILVDATGPVIIDLPQAIDAAANNNASRLLERDVANLADFFGRFAPELLKTHYGPEIWALYESGKLEKDSPLTGRFKRPEKTANVREVLQVIDAAREEDAARRIRKATRTF
jgi:RIO kinase 1